MSLRAAFEDILEVTEPVEDVSMEEVQELAEELVEDSQDIEDTLTVVDTLEEEAEHVEVIQNAIEESDDLSEKEVLLHNVALEAIGRRICLPTDRLYPAVESKQGLGSKAMDMLRRMYEAIKAALAKVWNAIVDFVSSTKKLAERITAVAKETKVKAKEAKAVKEFQIPAYTGHFIFKNGELPTAAVVSKAKTQLITMIKTTEKLFTDTAKMHDKNSTAMNLTNLISITQDVWFSYLRNFEAPGGREMGVSFIGGRIMYKGGPLKAATGTVKLNAAELSGICDNVIAVCKEVYIAMNNAYAWAKIREREYDKLGVDWKKEEELVETDTLHLTNIIKYRKYLWT